MSGDLKQKVLDRARQLGFILAGVTTPEPPPHLEIFENWLAQGRQARMAYLARQSARDRRADPRLILPESRSILMLAVPYSSPSAVKKDVLGDSVSSEHGGSPWRGRIASYAWGEDYHEVLPARLKSLVEFIEREVGMPVPNRWYTDTGPILERDLAQRAGLGWIGKNTCLINPRQGSYFLIAEILLGIDLDPDPPVTTDHCGSCTRCLQACPTQCILPDRTLDAGRCISYLTIELKENIPDELRTELGPWVFGCDICQMVCPWNRFAPENGDEAFTAKDFIPLPLLTTELRLTKDSFNRKYKHTAMKRVGYRGYMRNVAVSLGNQGDESSLPALAAAAENSPALVQEHAYWAMNQVKKRISGNQP